MPDQELPFEGTHRRRKAGWRGWLLRQTEIVFRDDEGECWTIARDVPPSGQRIGYDMMVTADGTTWTKPSKAPKL